MFSTMKVERDIEARPIPSTSAAAAQFQGVKSKSPDIINGMPKRGKGRPPKKRKKLPEAVNESRKRHMPHSSQNSEDEDDEEEEDDSESKPKRGRGRPPKMDTELPVIVLTRTPSSQTVRPPVQSPSNDANPTAQKNNIFETLCATANSGSITYAEMDKHMEEYNAITNSELNEQIVALTSEEMKIEVCHVKEDEGEYMEMYEGIQATCFEAETQIAPATYRTGYIKIQPKTMRPIEEVGEDGPTTYVCLKGTVHFKTNAIKKSKGRVYLKGTQLSVGDTIILPRGIPYSYENRGHSEAKLQYSTLRMI